MIIDHIDPATRRVYLHADTVGVSLHPINIYKEMRTLRRTNESLQKYELFMSAAGNVPKGSGSYTERYVILLSGTRIVPFDVSQDLKVIGTVITDEGTSGRDCFDRTPLSIGTEIDIDYQPPQVEIMRVSTGSGLSDEQALLLIANHNMLLGIVNNLPSVATVSDLSELATSAELASVAKTSDLAGLAQSSDLTPLAKTSDLVGLAMQADLSNLQVHLIDAELHAILDAYTNKDDWKAVFDASNIHTALDSYANKDDFKATIDTSAIASAILAFAVENGESLADQMRLLRAALIGNIVDDGDGTATFRSSNGLVVRFTSTYDPTTGTRTVVINNAA